MPPGRPRKFDEDEVLQRAIGAFLTDGFEGASYEKIAREMGLSKPSLYNTFGDKLSLFQRVIDDYAVRASAHIIASFSHQSSLSDGVKRCFDRPLNSIHSPKGFHWGVF